MRLISDGMGLKILGSGQARVLAVLAWSHEGILDGLMRGLSNKIGLRQNFNFFKYGWYQVVFILAITIYIEHIIQSIL